ncbi:BOS complex subunit NOMO1-like protein [Drosera capensis]
MSTFDFLFTIALISALAISSVHSDSIHGCGGFIEASPGLIKARKPSDKKLDYSHITVELQTVDGLVKDRTQCAPNGYYFIPVYDKGSFLIKVKAPEGWSWHPDKVPVFIDHTGCNGNEDINFQFTGFSLSGRVLGAVGGESCQSRDGGPSDVAVELLSSAGDLISSVLTSSKGDYSFKNVTPGIYKLRASHPDVKVDIRSLNEVELGFGNGVVGDIFFVPGYDIRGLVVAQGNPILGVHIYLYSEDVLNVDCPQGPGDSPGHRKALCHTVSDEEGKFTFKLIPCGSYELVPYYKGENTVFDVSPPLITVPVEHQHVSVSQKFQVTGFSIGGRVMSGNGAGVDSARILVDGQERTLTDKNGYYKVDQVTSNKYTIEALKDHYKFSSLKDFLVLPNMASIPDIEAVSYDVCGVVKMADEGYKAKVALTHGPENVKPQMKHADQDGKFCFEVPPGDYRLSALPTSAERASELLFLPPYIDVSVRSPLLNVEFSQAQVDIHGNVVCKEKCDASTSVTLVALSGRGEELKKTTWLTDDSDKFIFTDVFPGKYRLEVKHVSADGATEDSWCWKQSSVDVDVGTDDVKGISFAQRGYWIHVVSSHDVDARIIHPDGEQTDLKIKKGSEYLCVESPGIHEVKFVNSCIFFGSSSVKIDTSDPQPIHLKGEKSLLKGQIILDSSSLKADDVQENIFIDVFLCENDVSDSVTASLVNRELNQASSVVYEYSVWANFGEKITFFPRGSRNNEVKRILFYPRQREVFVTRDGCQDLVPPFSGRMGLYIEGSVSPPLSGVNIRIIAMGDGGNAPLKKGEVALETTTTADGTFIGGPLYDDISYTVEASLPGYHLKAIGPYSFFCQKLGQISVRIFSKEETGEPFPSVLLSLSGEDGYRNNTIAKAGGSFSFDDLFPGTFYLRPLLKEYAFSPAAQAIELGSGESKDIIFEATRVAYSAMGVVTLLTGQPIEGTSIEARSVSKGYYEETLTDSSGSYRIRGLLPDTRYIIKVVNRDDVGGATSRIERASPESVSVKVGSEDIKGLDFLVFEKPEKTILSCHVEGERFGELDSHLHVEVKSASEPSKVEAAFPLPLSRFFQVKDLPRGRHLVVLRSGLPLTTHKFVSEVIEVDLEEHTQIHVGPLRYSLEETIHKQELTPASVFPLVIGVAVILFFISMPRLKDLYQAASGAVLSSSFSTSKKEARKPAIRRRTF